MRRVALVAGAVAATICVVVVVWWRAGRSAGDGPARVAEPSRPPLRPALRMQTVDAGEFEPSAAAPAVTTAVDEPAAPPDPPADRAPGPGGPPPTRAALTEVFAAERRNAEWASGKERVIRDRLAGLVDAAVARGSARVEVGEVECRYRVCRVAVGGADDRAQARVLDWMGDEQGFANLALDMHVTRASGGFTIYLRFGR